MADTIKYVDPDVVGGAGDGSSWANAYNNLQQAQSDWSDPIASGDRFIFECRCSSGGQDTTQVNVGNAWQGAGILLIRSTDNTYELVTTSYAIVFSTGGSLNLECEDLHLESTNTGGAVTRPIWFSYAATSGDAIFRRCFIKSYMTGGSSAIYGIWSDTANWDSTFINCVIISGSPVTTNSTGFICDNGGTHTFYNNTFVGYGTTPRGFDDSVGSGTYVLRNNIFTGHGDIYYGTFSSIDSDYNTTDTGSYGSYGGTNDLTSQTFDFFYPSGEDFHLKVTDIGATDNATNLSGTFTDDHDGNTRPPTGPWDCGAFMYVYIDPDTVYFVDPDVSGGLGDGSSWANAYSTLEAAQLARAGTILGGYRVIFECRASSGSPDTVAVEFGAWQGAGTLIFRSTDKTYRLTQTDYWAMYADLSSGINWECEDFQFEVTYTTGDSYCLMIDASSASSTVKMQRCYLYLFAPGDESPPTSQVIYCNGNNIVTDIYNNLIIVESDDNPEVYMFAGVNGGTHTIYNNTFVVDDTDSADVTAIAIDNGGSVLSRNNVFYNVEYVYFVSSSSMDSDYNTTTHTDYDGYAGTNDLVSQSFTFVGAGSYNFRLDEADTGAKDNATNLSGTFNDDYDGLIRPSVGAWDCGAFELGGLGDSTFIPTFRGGIARGVYLGVF